MFVAVTFLAASIPCKLNFFFNFLNIFSIDYSELLANVQELRLHHLRYLVKALLSRLKLPINYSIAIILLGLKIFLEPLETHKDVGIFIFT
jgi:hypothetical protein